MIFIRLEFEFNFTIEWFRIDEKRHKSQLYGRYPPCSQKQNKKSLRAFIKNMADQDIDLSKERYPTITKVDVVGNVPVATATAVPMMAQQQQTFSTSNLMSQEALSTLREQGFPLGLAQELGNTKAKYPIRYWIVDNSGYVLL